MEDFKLSESSTSIRKFFILGHRLCSSDCSKAMLVSQSTYWGNSSPNVSFLLCLLFMVLYKSLWEFFFLGILFNFCPYRGSMSCNPTPWSLLPFSVSELFSDLTSNIFFSDIFSCLGVIALLTLLNILLLLSISPIYILSFSLRLYSPVVICCHCLAFTSFL